MRGYGRTDGRRPHGRTTAARTVMPHGRTNAGPTVQAHHQLWLTLYLLHVGVLVKPASSVPVSYKVLTSGWCPGSHYEPTSPVVYLHLGVVSSFLSTSVPASSTRFLNRTVFPKYRVTLTGATLLPHRVPACGCGY